MPTINANGVELFYTEQGHGAETLVFGHGLLMDSSMWDFITPHFIENYRVICFDFRGQGQSAKPGKGFEIDNLVKDIAALIQSISETPVHYVGLSMGGMVGMPLAARHPELLRSLVLLDTSAQAEPRRNKNKYAVMTLIVKVFGIKSLVPRTLPLMFGKSTMKDPALRDLVRHWKQKLLSLKKDILGPIAGVTQRRDVTSELSKINCPTLIVVGEEDRTTPPICAKTIHVHIANSELQTILQCGHSSALEKPEQVLALMKEFYLRLRLL
ncbi:MAG: alpha/beta hydrolase [Arenimonas sp.]